MSSKINKVEVLLGQTYRTVKYFILVQEMEDIKSAVMKQFEINRKLNLYPYCLGMFRVITYLTDYLICTAYEKVILPVLFLWWYASVHSVRTFSSKYKNDC
jgi:hypothetical protein